MALNNNSAFNFWFSKVLYQSKNKEFDMLKDSLGDESIINLIIYEEVVLISKFASR